MATMMPFRNLLVINEAPLISSVLPLGRRANQLREIMPTTFGGFPAEWSHPPSNAIKFNSNVCDNSQRHDVPNLVHKIDSGSIFQQLCPNQ
jgi:hypothetical protein